ncbi:hypothetical protein K458DRAFT_424013 [Lentithecium fluviatile CBS 122367]|uniref:Zn(2)-C6 fungal-type domain-containing protein n=1 Tax=Lentithecium fluviatile CBS 122367 TaxID=1168545 RepID=A0A6G1IGY3_9PLEO|nr:hypothetical protein K458DRAFT_424013 [Lentithecium fluviatile CBS 122367]
MSDDVLHTAVAADRVQKANGSISGASPAPNPRSCVTCRKRKVKCDKKQPCSNCTRAKIECIFPGPGRAPRKSRKPPDGELMDRLKRLEGVVQSLNAQVEEHEQEAAEREKKREGSASDQGCPNEARESRRSVVADNSVEGLETRFGRLVVDQGRSRYINNSFWASLNNEVEDLKSILIEQSDDEEDQDSPDTGYSSQHQGFIFGYSSTNVDMLSLHPTPERALEFWAIYKENVDPLVKVLHIPTFEPVLLDAIAHPEKASKSLEPLMFAMYYGAVTSITPKDSVEQWGEERNTLLQKYRFGLEQGLARANFLFCDEMVILQAFVVFLILLRRNDDARKIWTLTGLAVRIAQTLGIHRDGSHFGLSPFEIEMRRRLWWQVCILDARSSEDHGCDPTIVEAQFDTKMPLNVNDTDLDPNMAEMPEERRGFTDMTFCLIRFEVTNIFRRILYVPPGNERCNMFFANLTVPEKEKWISDCHQRLEDKYLRDCDMTIPLCWVTATISRLVMSKMWLIVYHPHQRRDGGASLPQETKDKLFITSLENIEYSILLETEARTMKWGWLFRTYVQWHAIAFLLSELCVRTKGEAVDRAWRALEATAGRWWFPLQDTSPFSKGQAGCLWKPLRKLMAKARAAREKELALERASQALLRNGGAHFADFPQMLEQLPNAAMAHQPNPQNLDRMLRPTAPKLGEMPAAQPPTWTGSPPMTNSDNLYPDTMGSIPTYNAMSSNITNNVTGGAANEHKNINALDQFNSLSEHGLDYLIGDVMDGFTTGGLPANTTFTNNTENHNSANNFFNVPNTNQTFTNPNPFSQNQAPINDSPESMANANSSGQSTDSPVLVDGAEGSMDWEVWDDLVNQYGMEAHQQQTTVTANGTGHLGMVHWF